jgi:serine/threonine-protein kinase
MAVVFRALDERLGRPVALKILSPGLASDSGFRRRFIAESRAAAAVDDPHIIPVYEAGEAGSVLFIAMRFVAGGDLRQVLEREGALAPDRAADFVSPVASALDAAHGAGLVHRDVKPGNILVDARAGRPDHVYLSDFGIVKGAVTGNLTGVGSYIGTPEYMAPEQISGHAVDGRTDQYSLGCVAFQLLTGMVPFQRDQLPAVIYAHLSVPPPSLVSLRSDLPAAVDQVVARAMAKTRAERYESCGDFADALREALGLASYHRHGSVTAPPHPPDPGLPPRTITVPPVESASEPGRLTAADDVTGDTSDVLAPGSAPADRQPSLPSPADISPPTSDTPSRRPRWPHRRNRPVPKQRSSAVASMPGPGATAGSDEQVGEPGLLTTATDHPSAPGQPAPTAADGAEALPAAAAVAENQPNGDPGTIVSPDEPGLLSAAAQTDVLAPVQAPAAATTSAGRQLAGDPGTTPGESAAELPWLTVPGSGGDGGRPVRRAPRRRGSVTAWIWRHRLPVFALACAAVAAAVTLTFISASPPASSGSAASSGPSSSPRPVAIGSGLVRLGNLSGNPSPVDVYLYPSGSSSPQFVGHDVAYGTILPYQSVRVGDYSVKVRAAGASASSTPVWSVSFIVQAGGAYTVVPLRATAQQGQLKVIDNNLTTPNGKSFVRVIQADLNQGQVTFHCSCAPGAPGNITTDAAPGTVSPQVPIPAGTWTMTATGPSAKTSLPVALTAGTVHTEIVISRPDGGIEIVNLVDSLPSYRRVAVDLPSNWRNVPITSVAFSPSGATLAIASEQICLRDIAATACSGIFGSASAYSLAFSPDGKTLAVADSSGHTSLWNVATSSQTATLTDPNSPSGAWSVAFSPDGQTLAVGDGSGHTYLWDVATRKLIVTLSDPGPKGVNSVAFTHDGKILAVGDGNGPAYLWDVATRKLIFALSDPGGKGVMSVAFSPDGKLLVAGDGKGQTYVWQVATGKLMTVVRNPGTTGVISVACSPDDTTMAAGDNNGRIYVWNVDNGKLLATLTDPNNVEIDSVAFSSTGQVLATGDQNGSVFLWYMG